MAQRTRAPFSPPDCPWREMQEGSKLPDQPVETAGKLNGDSVYIGRVYDADSNFYLVGSALPAKNKCLYLGKDGKIKSTSTYDILTYDCSNPCEFRHMDINSNLLFVAAGDEDTCLYAAKVVDGPNTYIGWADKATETVHIPRESNNQVKDDYGIMVHKFLDRLCICPMPPGPHE